jgi:hypothetical protein
LAYGPLVLFALTEGTPAVTPAQLLAAARLSPESGEWFAETGGARLHFKPFWAIEDERYSTYLTTKAPDEI